MSLKKFNYALCILPVLIFANGFITLLSNSPEKAKSQLIFFLIGYFVFLLISLIDYSIYKYYWKHLLAFITLLLLITYFVGDVRFGSVRWFSIGVFNIQPSEFAKVILIISLSSILSSKEKYLESFWGLIKLSLVTTPLLFLVLLQPDLGTFIILSGLFASLLLFAELDLKYVLLGFIILGFLSAPIWNSMHDYQQKRVLVFLNPGLETQGSGYNVLQSIIAVGSGGLLGKGFLRGTQAHLGFLPAFWTDFIFASFAEEWGFLGVVVLLLLYGYFLASIVKVFSSSSDPFGRFLCVGIFIVYFIQITINIGMNLGVMPVTGIPLPFMSYGGSSLISLFISLGMVNSVWIWRKV